jgi:hypothetical protein
MGREAVPLCCLNRKTHAESAQEDRRPSSGGNHDSVGHSNVADRGDVPLSARAEKARDWRLLDDLYAVDASGVTDALDEGLGTNVPLIVRVHCAGRIVSQCGLPRAQLWLIPKLDAAPVTHAQQRLEVPTIATHFVVTAGHEKNAPLLHIEHDAGFSELVEKFHRSSIEAKDGRGTGQPAALGARPEKAQVPSG